MFARPIAAAFAAATLFAAGCATADQEPAPAGRAADLAVFERQMFEVDQSYSPEDEARARAAFEDLTTRADALTDAAFELALSEIAAMAGNGHTFVRSPWETTYEALPIRYFYTADGLFIADASEDHEALIGARVTAIDGREVEEFRSAWRRYFAGSPTRQDDWLPRFLEAPALLHAAGLIDSADAVALDLANGETVTVSAGADWEASEGFWALLRHARALELAAAGRIAGDPLYLQEPDALLRMVELPARDAVYIQFRANIDFTREIDFRARTAEMAQALREIGPRYVIVDQRFNLGGDLNTTRDLMQAIPEIVGPDGHVFAFISGRTFSAGIASTAYLEQAGGDRVTLIGQPVGDALEFWAEGDVAQLPDSGLYALAATERHNYMTGCPQADCHGSIRTHPIAIESLEPDVAVETRYEDVVSGRDAYLEAAFALMDE